MLKMKTIETPWLKLSRFLGIGFGIPFTLLGIFLYFNYSNTAFLINGILWLGVALILLLKGKWDEHKLGKIMKYGDCYDASYIKVIPLNMIKIGSYVTARIKCKYKVNGVEYMVISGPYLLSPWDKSENLHIIIYVSKNNKNRYAVVAFRKEDIFEV